MIRAYVPKQEDLWFRQTLLADPETMGYNHAWGGTIPFPMDQWSGWYDNWVVHTEGKRFYRYLVNDENEFVGEIAYHYDEARAIHIADILVLAKYRGNGFGELGLQMLCELAKSNGLKVLYDDIAIDNPAVKMFLGNGFYEEYRTDEIMMLKKDL